MPRTTVNIDAVVLRELKRRQKAEGKPLGLLMSELLARALSKQEEDQELPSFHWSSRPMRARVDLEDKDALYAALDQP